MSCNKKYAQFVITKGLDNVFEFTIKQNNSTMPIVIEAADTFKAIVRLLSDSSVALEKDMVVKDAANGIVSLTLTKTETELLEASRGPVEDRYYAKPMYSLVIDAKTAANGDFIARVNEVYVS